MLSFLYCSIGVSSCATVLLEELKLAKVCLEEERTLGRRGPLERRLSLGKESGEAVMLLK